MAWLAGYQLIDAALLANIARYLTLPLVEHAYVTSLFVAAHIPRFGYVLQAGQPTRSLAFGTRGCLRTYSTGGQGKATVLSFAWEGWWGGDVASAASGNPATLTRQAWEAPDVLHLLSEAVIT